MRRIDAELARRREEAIDVAYAYYHRVMGWEDNREPSEAHRSRVRAHMRRIEDAHTTGWILDAMRNEPFHGKEHRDEDGVLRGGAQDATCALVAMLALAAWQEGDG